MSRILNLISVKIHFFIYDFLTKTCETCKFITKPVHTCQLKIKWCVLFIIIRHLGWESFIRMEKLFEWFFFFTSVTNYNIQFPLTLLYILHEYELNWLYFIWHCMTCSTFKSTMEYFFIIQVLLNMNQQVELLNS